MLANTQTHTLMVRLLLSIVVVERAPDLGNNPHTTETIYRFAVDGDTPKKRSTRFRASKSSKKPHAGMRQDLKTSDPAFFISELSKRPAKGQAYTRLPHRGATLISHPGTSATQRVEGVALRKA